MCTQQHFKINQINKKDKCSAVRKHVAIHMTGVNGREVWTDNKGGVSYSTYTAEEGGTGRWCK